MSAILWAPMHFEEGARREEKIVAGGALGGVPSEWRLKLGARLLRYVFGGYALYIVLALQEVPPEARLPIFGVFVAQLALSAPLGMLLPRPRLFPVVNALLAIINFSAQAAIIILAGGYPTRLWVSAMFGVLPASYFIGSAGVLINAATMGAALLVPRLSELTREVVLGVGDEVAVVVVIGFMTELTFRMLVTEQEERNQAEAALREANERLVATLDEHRRQVAEKSAIGEMTDLLQSCTEIDETLPIIARAARRLFPTRSGALFLYSASRDSLDPLARWGSLEPRELRPFLPAECWGLRRGRAHESDTTSTAVTCAHVTADRLERRVLCVPLSAQGEVLGVFLLQDDAAGEDPARERLDELAASVASQLALQFANLRLRETLRNQAIRDPLTHLYNRRYLEETLTREARRARQQGLPLALAMIDVDHFKVFNDTHGHAAGDAVLQEVGTYLKIHTRPDDIACRYGGEELAVVFVDTPLADAVTRAEELRAGLATLVVQHRGRSLGGITVSIGVAAMPELRESDLLKGADAALYQAKHQGRNQVVAAPDTSRASHG